MIIPADTKEDLKREPVSPSGSRPMPTTNPFPNPILEQQVEAPAYEPPPYSETDTASQGWGASPDEKIPESNAISASGAVNITGPLHILGYVESFCLVDLETGIRRS